MEVDTGLDVAWCLTCSRSTRDARSPYCSDTCRVADAAWVPNPASSSKIPFTSPIPADLYTSSPIKPFDRRRSSASPTKASAPRPPLASRAATFLPPASEVSFSPPKNPSGQRRDRRAFSFPSAPNSPPMLFSAREHRGSTTLPPFVRRDIVASMTPKSPGLISVKEDKRTMKDILTSRLAKSTGGQNTPGTGGESVFLSTSESSEDDAELRVKVLASSATPAPLATTNPDPKASTPFSTLRSQLTLGRNTSLARNTSISPVGAMIASSASSRSREDIISWAKAINRRNGAEDDDEEATRGRPRNQRTSTLARVPPPFAEQVEEELAVDDGASNGYGTTPKGRIGSALAGLTGYGGSIVKALTSVTASPSKPPPARKILTPGRPGSSTSDFAVTPSAAEVARVAVVASTMPLDDGQSSHYMIGGPSTLSTLSFSEAIDPSTAGTQDQVEIVTDDGVMSVTSSIPARRRGSKLQSRKGSIASVPPPVPDRQQRPAPARPITTSIWNLSSYLTRFSPFALTSTTTPPTSKQPARPVPSQQSSNSTVISTATASPDQEATSPLPALRSRPDTPESPAQQLVRSVPMDIAIPPSTWTEVVDYQPAQSPLDTNRLRSSRSRARSRSRRRTRSRSSSAGKMLDRAGEAIHIEDVSKGVGMTNQDPDADADVSDEESVAKKGCVRGRERGRGRETGDDRTRGRGRDRSVKVI